jgi:putative ABC transport system permease protein
MLGVVGTLIGMGCGVVLAFLGTYFVGRAFEVQLPRLVEVMTIWPFVIGGVFGLVMAFLGAVVPALIAGRVSPLEGMNRVVGQPKRSFTLLFLIGGLLLTGGGFGVIFGSIGGWLPIDWATIAAVALLIGLVMLDSLVLGPQTSLVAALFRPLFRVETALAQKQVLRHHLRSALTVGVLFIAGSTGVGMANSILDSVRDVHEWYDQAIQGDYFVRAMMPDMATGTSADLPDGLGEDLAQVPHIRTLDGAAFVEGKIPQPGVDPSEYLTVIVIARDFNEKHPPFDLVEGDRNQIGDQIRAGQVVIGTVLSQRLDLHAGDELPLETKDGTQKAQICGVANEYMVGGLAVHMYRPLAMKWLGVEGVDGFVLKVEEGYREAVRPQLEQIARKYDVILMSHGDIRRTVDQFVSGTEWSLWLLVWMGFVVASFGVVNTLTMNVLEQTRELGLLRIVAMTKTQVRRTILAQALIIGGVGLPPGVAMGVVIAYVINLAMMPSFGHPIDFHFYPRMILFTLAGALVIVVAAAIIPARRATQINLVEALHYE